MSKRSKAFFFFLIGMAMVALLGSLTMRGQDFNHVTRNGVPVLTPIYPIDGSTISNAVIVNNRSINGVPWIDGVTVTGIAQCLSAAAAAKSVCEVPPNYSESVPADITVTND